MNAENIRNSTECVFLNCSAGGLSRGEQELPARSYVAAGGRPSAVSLERCTLARRWIRWRAGCRWGRDAEDRIWLATIVSVSLLITALAAVVAGYLINQVPPLKVLVTRLANSLAVRTHTGTRGWTAGIYAVVVAIAAGATALVTQLNSSAAPNAPMQPATGGVSPTISVEPTQGKPGSTFHASVKGFHAGEVVRLELFRGANLLRFDGPYLLRDIAVPADGDASIDATMPEEICCAGGTVLVRATSIGRHIAAPDSVFTLR